MTADDLDKWIKDQRKAAKTYRPPALAVSLKTYKQLKALGLV